MDASITRRDFLGATLLASGGALLGGLTPAELLATSSGQSAQPTSVTDELTGYGGIGDYANSNGNTFAVLSAGHRMRDRAYKSLAAVDTGEIYDCVIVGGGISGIAAALFFVRQAGPNKKILLLENHPIFGGEAKQNEFDVDGRHLTVHQGSAIYQIPYPHSFIARFYDSIGLHTPRLTYQSWGGSGPEMPTGRTPYESPGLPTGQYAFYFGAKFGAQPGVLLVDPLGKDLKAAPLAPLTKVELLRWFRGLSTEKVKFRHPQYEGDPISRYLDTITLEQHYMERFGISQETIRTFLSPVEGGGSGLGPDALSAYNDYAYEALHPYEAAGEMDQMFPGGNATIARLMMKTLMPASITGEPTVEGVTSGKVQFAALDDPHSPARIRLSSTVLSVQHDGDPDKSETLAITYENRSRLFKIKARSAVMAGGSWTTKHIIPDLPEPQRAAYAQFYRSPCMMANVAVRNWRFLKKAGITGCRWFDGVGNYFDVTRKALVGDTEKTINPDFPIVLSIKVLYPHPGLSTEEQGNKGRLELLSTSFKEYERRIRQQFTEMFERYGFDAQREIAGIILNRWGHAYVSPQPGFFFGKNGQPAPREVLRNTPHGRVAFANTDLAGAMDHRNSILEAHRAVQQLLDQVLT